MKAQDIIIAKYGQPGNEYLHKYCTLWQVKNDFPWFPAKTIYINKEFEVKLFAAFKEIEAHGLKGEIKTFDGCYSIRNVRGSARQSLHSWAMAIDMNSATEKLGQEKTNWSDQFINIMVSHGIYWGGNYSGRKDPMHFSLYNG